MTSLIRAGLLGAALLVAQTASAQLFRPADNAPPSPPAVAAKLASRGELKGIRVYEMRMVRRNDDAVTATIIGGQLAYTAQGFSEGFGTARGFGRFLRRGERVSARQETNERVDARESGGPAAGEVRAAS